MELWNTGESTGTQFDNEWDDLTIKQKKSAKILGYDHVTWCIDFEEYESELEVRREYYPEYAWDDLPPPVQVAAQQFGFTPTTWDQDVPVLGFDTDWDALSSDLQAAAITLGYDAKTWCDEEQLYHEDEQSNFIDDDWSDLPQNVKEAAKVLGFDDYLWVRSALFYALSCFVLMLLQIDLFNMVGVVHTVFRSLFCVQ